MSLPDHQSPATKAYAISNIVALWEAYKPYEKLMEFVNIGLSRTKPIWD